MLVAAAARRLGRPVKWVEGRREHFLATGHDREQEHEIRVGFARDGAIVGVDGAFLADVGAYPAAGDGLTANTVNHLLLAVSRAPLPQHRRGRGDDQDAQRRLPRGRPAGSRVRDGAPDRHRRAPARPRSRRRAPQESDPCGGDALSPRPHLQGRRAHHLRPRRLPRRVRARRSPCSTTRRGASARPPSADGPSASASASPATRKARGSGPTRARRSASIRAARSTSTSASPRRARATPPRSRRSPPPSWARASTTCTVMAGDTCALPVRHGHRRQPRDGQRRSRGRAHRARGAGQGRPRGRRAAGVRARRRAHRAGRAFVAGLPDRSLPLGRVAQRRREVEGAASRPASPGSTRARTSIRTRSRGRSARNAAAVEVDVETGRVRLLQYAAVHDPGPRHQSGDRGGPAPGRRRRRASAPA